MQVIWHPNIIIFASYHGMRKLMLFFQVIGIGTLLRQFHPSHVNKYVQVTIRRPSWSAVPVNFIEQKVYILIYHVQYMGQYVRTIAETAFGTGYGPHKESPDQASEVLTFTPNNFFR